jgi:hypothetical protein
MKGAIQQEEVPIRMEGLEAVALGLEGLPEAVG